MAYGGKDGMAMAAEKVRAVLTDIVEKNLSQPASNSSKPADATMRQVDTISKFSVCRGV